MPFILTRCAREGDANFFSKRMAWCLLTLICAAPWVSNKMMSPWMATKNRLFSTELLHMQWQKGLYSWYWCSYSEIICLFIYLSDPLSTYFELLSTIKFCAELALVRSHKQTNTDRHRLKNVHNYINNCSCRMGNEIKCNFLIVLLFFSLFFFFLLTGKTSPDVHLASGKGESVIFLFFIFIFSIPGKLCYRTDGIIQGTICSKVELLVFPFTGI